MEQEANNKHIGFNKKITPYKSMCYCQKKRMKENKNDSRLIYSLPCSSLILETKGKGSHHYYFQVVVGFACFLCCVFSSSNKEINKIKNPNT